MDIECKFIQEFDAKKKYQYVNNEPSVLHCHHYATLFTRLALDTKMMGGPKLLAQSMEESSYLLLKKYFIAEKIKPLKDRVSIIEEYFKLMGLGKLQLSIHGYMGGRAKMLHSHLDEGWIKKWGKCNHPVNFVGQGYLAAAFAVINNRPLYSYKVQEISSIVCGNPYSEFMINER